MYIVNKLDYKHVNNEWHHISTRLIKTFSERKQAEEYLHGCLSDTNHVNTERHEYTLVKLGV